MPRCAFVHRAGSERPLCSAKLDDGHKGKHMQDIWHFEEETEGWRWVRTDLLSGSVSRSPDLFMTRSACMVDALGNGYLVSRRSFGPARTATVH